MVELQCHLDKSLSRPSGESQRLNDHSEPPTLGRGAGSFVPELPQEEGSFSEVVPSAEAFPREG